jgi:hypothetical protein
MKEELNKDMENLREKKQLKILEIKITFSQKINTVDGHSSRLNDIIDIKEKNKISKTNNSRAVKGICKSSVTPSKDQT